MAGILTITCEKTGGGAYLVDGGRPGYRALGVPSGGPVDATSVTAANELLQQTPDTPCLELTLTGGRWLLAGEGQICLTGADMGWQLNGRPVDTYTAINITGKVLLTGGPAQRGLRGYLAARGDWALARRLGSMEAGVPGMTSVEPGWAVTVRGKPMATSSREVGKLRMRSVAGIKLTVHPGPEWCLLRPDQQRELLRRVYHVSRNSNRQGIRLISAAALEVGLPPLISSPVLPGTIQLTPSGPVLLGPDAQTIGGYPRVLLVTDPGVLARAFQRPLGSQIRLILG